MLQINDKFRVLSPIDKDLDYTIKSINNDLVIVSWIDSNDIPEEIDYKLEDVNKYFEKGTWIKV